MNLNAFDGDSSRSLLSEADADRRRNDGAGVGLRARAKRTPVREKPKVLLVFDSSWEDSRGILLGVAQYAKRSWQVRVDPDGAALSEHWWERPQSWDGVITRHVTPFLLDHCRRLRLPVVDVSDSPPVGGVPKIRPDNFMIGRLAAEHLVSLGYRTFAFCGLAESWSAEREAGFRETLKAAGFDCREFGDGLRETRDPGWTSEQEGVLANWLAGLPVPIGILGCNDLRALHLLAAARIAGLSVPGEIGVVGVNNDHLRCAFSSPSLSSVATDLRLAGHQAAEVLDRMIASRALGAGDDVRIAPLQVVGRQSTDALAVSDSAVRLALQFIRESAGPGLSVADVAAKLGVDRHSLERRFRRSIGRSPHAEIRLTRISRIKRLLVETDLPLKQISSEVGVPHAEYMNVMFRRLTGETPGAFRRRHRTRRAGAVTAR